MPKRANLNSDRQGTKDLYESCYQSCKHHHKRSNYDFDIVGGYLCRRYGYKTGSLPSGDYIAVRISNPSNYDIGIPSGNEIGANDYWIPGGYTIGEVPEAIVNYVPNNTDCVSFDNYYLEVK